MNEPEPLGQCIPPQGTSYQCCDTDLDLNPDPYPLFGSPQNLTICSLAHCQLSMENFMQIRSEVFCAKLQTDKRTDKQTNKQRR